MKNLARIRKKPERHSNASLALLVIHSSLACAQSAQALTPSVVPSAVSTVPLIDEEDPRTKAAEADR